MMITIRPESILVLEDCPLLTNHFHEVESWRDELPLNPDWGLYELIEESGNLVCVVCRDNSEIVGYLICIITPSVHSAGHLLAEMDSIFLKPEYRGTDLSKRMIERMESELKPMGISMLSIVMKHDKPFKLPGFTPFEIKYSKYIGD